MTESYYATLHIKQTATKQQIMAAYRRLAPQYHPDVVEQKIKAKLSSGAITEAEAKREKDEAAAKWAAINNAYSVLNNPDAKDRYDTMLNKLMNPEQLAQMREQIKLKQELKDLNLKSAAKKVTPHGKPIMQGYRDIASLFDWYYQHS